MDTSFLLGGKGVEAPDPLAMAGKGLTLAQLMNTVQAGNMGLETQRQTAAAYSDPDVLRQLGAALGGGGGIGGGSPLDLSVLSKYGLATPGLVEGFQKMGIQSATIAKDRAEALKAEVESRTKQIATASQFAMKAADNPTPQNIQGYLRQHSFAGLPADFFGPMPPLGSPKEAWQTYLTGVAAASQDPAAQLAIAKQAVMLPREALASDVGTAKAALETQQMPQKLSISQQEANTGSFNAATTRAGFTAPEMFFPPGSNVPQFRSKDMGGGMTIAPGVGETGGTIRSMPGNQTPPGTPSGAPVNAPSNTAAQTTRGVVKPPAIVDHVPGERPTLGEPPGRIKLNEAAAGKVADMQDTLPTIYSALQRFNSLKQQIEGDQLMTGPVFGSNGMKQIAGMVSGLPGMPPGLRERVANTQVADATALSGVFNLMGEGKGTLPRSTAALDMLVSAKPGTTQYKDAMLALTNALISDLDMRVKIIDNAARSVGAGGSVTSEAFPAPTLPGGPNTGWSIKRKQ